MNKIKKIIKIIARIILFILVTPWKIAFAMTENPIGLFLLILFVFGILPTILNK